MSTINVDTLECIFYDFDGVMTDNRVLVSEDGKESVFANRGDGLGVSYIKKMGIPQVIVSTEQNKVVEQRAKKLNIEVIHGVSDKGEVISSYCSAKGFDLSRTAFIGNDLNDLPAFNIVGFKGAPKDAAQEVLAIADWISDKNGGEGVIRDFYRFISSK
ncbi:MAG: HAD hydrolase family protein [Bacteroidales bacterium]|nr:HAD hydrolase family protein [Bacteroidales bacterium]